MSQKLTWSYNVYENIDAEIDKEFVAPIATISFDGTKNLLIMYYSVLNDYEKGFILNFVCNDEMFCVGKYQELEIAYDEAEVHLKSLHKLIYRT